MADSGEITKLLQAGDGESLDRLLPVVYDELKRIAARLFKDERAGHTLQPTALVHEAYMRLIKDGENVSWQSRAHFFGIAAESMREILVNHAYKRNAQKRGGGLTRIELDESVSFSFERDLDVLSLNECLERLARLDEREARIVELRFFGGLTIDETAAVMDISTATVEREWKVARAWLYDQMNHC